MGILKHVEQLMTEIGPLCDELHTVLQRKDDEWAIRLNERDFFAKYNHDTELVTLATDVGMLSGEEREKIYKALLSYNIMWQTTDGISMGLDNEDRIQLMISLGAANLERGLLVNVIENISEKADFWQELLKSMAKASTIESHDNGLSDLFNPALLKA
ncbi:type III secretion system chaperone [Thalassomonas viridans]|uniref:Type III secretion system chaperone n=1 Tax=Thalassomonas viridans TaxID=137584 RepID=A0AAE9Z9G5_9GAMM|nr:type III secretion system chaperone [Thalassomonas viridans]WDE08464.1 type III secretion system chaperone [Thalassomonas viridans]